MSDDNVYARRIVEFNKYTKKITIRLDVCYKAHTYSIDFQKGSHKKALREIVAFVLKKHKVDFDKKHFTVPEIIPGYNCDYVKIPNSYFKTKGSKTSDNKI